MDNAKQIFYPPRRRGLLVNIGVTVGLSLLALALLLLAAQSPLGLQFLAYLIGALFITAPIPTLTSRTYALVRSQYEVDREGLRLKWGFREVALPMQQITFVELAEDYLYELKFPRLQWPGAVTGQNTQEHLGKVEFLASEKTGLVMVGTEKRVFIISPDKPKQFVLTYRQMIELGSISPMKAYSAAPSFFLIDIWRIPLLRLLLITTTVLSLALFVLVAWAIPTLTQVSLGFDALGQPLEPVAPGSLFLLPALNLIFLVFSYLVSVWLFRTQKNHPLVSVLWSSNTLTAILFLAAVLFILSVS